jgi:hypothetical protein
LAVPELTRKAGIQLNERVSLQRQTNAVASSIWTFFQSKTARVIFRMVAPFFQGSLNLFKGAKTKNYESCIG